MDTNYAEAAHQALLKASERLDLKERERFLQEAQVYATLAVAAALEKQLKLLAVIQLGMKP